MNRNALIHPLAVALLLTSLALAGACQWLPPLRAWAWLAGWLVVWGVGAYAVTMIGLGWAGRLSEPLELRELHAIRQALARRLTQQRAREREGPATTWTSVLSEAVERIDDDVEPALRELLLRHESVSRHLRLYESGRLPLPDQEFVRRLRTIEWRQRAAIDESVRQASNAEAALLALLEERHDGDVAERARGWTDELLLLHDTLVSALSGDPNVVELREPIRETDATNGEPASPAELPLAEYRVSARRNGAVAGAGVLARHVEEALRSLSNLGALGTCELVADLPHTLGAARGGRDGELSEPTPLEQAQTLHEVLRAAIDRLKPANGPNPVDGVPSLGHEILLEEYVLRRSTRNIMVRHFVSESTLHRHRHAAIRALANDLMAHEKRLARGRTNGSAATSAGAMH